MADQQFSGVTPVGRIIAESIFEKTNKGFKGKILDSPQHYLQIAIPKNSGPELQRLFDNCVGAATSGFQRGEQNRPDFAWKYKDGDAPENVTREGWPGCYVFTFRTGFDLVIVDQNFHQIIDRNKIRPGYQVRVSYSIVANENADKPGVYLNFDMVQLVSIDKEIRTGPAPSTVFSTPVTALPLQPGALVNQGRPGPAPAPPAYPGGPGPAPAPPAYPGGPGPAPAPPAYPGGPGPAPAPPAYPGGPGPAPAPPAYPGGPGPAPAPPAYPGGPGLVYPDPTFLQPPNR